MVPSDPCYFFRSQAYRKGLDHYATKMLWVCQMMAQMRGARLPLSDRLLATEAAFESYRTRYFETLQTWYQDQGNRGYSHYNWSSTTTFGGRLSRSPVCCWSSNWSRTASRDRQGPGLPQRMPC